MKIVFQSDIHLRSTTPVNRIDDYMEAQFDKLEQLVGFANLYDAQLMLGGDIFDSHKVSAEVISRAIEVFDRCENDVFACSGQNDLPYHEVALRKSPVFPLYFSGGISYCGDDWYMNMDSAVGVVHFCSWEKTPTKPQPGQFNILLGHISVFEGSVPFYFKGEAYTPKTLREKYPGFDLYLCGDIHLPCVDGNVVVSGSMMRMSINQVDYRPRAYLIDTETMKIEPLYYEIKDDVFGVPDKKVESTLNLDDLISAMKSNAVGRESYKRDCFALAKDDEDVKLIMGEIFDEFN